MIWILMKNNCKKIYKFIDYTLSHIVANKYVTCTYITHTLFKHILSIFFNCFFFNLISESHLIFLRVINFINSVIYFSFTRYIYEIKNAMSYLTLEKGNRRRFWYIESIGNGRSQWSYNSVSTSEWNYENGEPSISVL